MEVRTCQRCGKIEIASEAAFPEPQLDVGGTVFPLCSECYNEFLEWFYHVEVDTSCTKTA